MKRYIAFFAAVLFLLPTVLPCSANECGKDAKGQIALTFDDGPSEKYTGRILDLLKKYNVRATFFLVGTNVCMAPDIVKRESREGHELGNHTFTHPHMKTQTRPSLEYELNLTSDVIYRACGKHPTLFRPPEGILSDAVLSASDSLGYRRVLWTIDTMDWAHRSADEIVKNVLKNAGNGSIILMHDYIVGESHTEDALEIIIPELLARGFEFVTVSELK